MGVGVLFLPTLGVEGSPIELAFPYRRRNTTSPIYLSGCHSLREKEEVPWFVCYQIFIGGAERRGMCLNLFSTVAVVGDEV